MSLKTKAFIYNFIGFALLFLGVRYLLLSYTSLGFLAVVIAGVIAIVASPKFAMGPVDGKEQLFVKWIFFKGVKKVNF